MSETNRIDRFLVMHAARADQWREVLTAADQWAAGTGSAAKVADELRDIAIIEELHAYPGVRLLSRLHDRLSAGDAAATAAITRRISDAILTNAFAQQAEGETTSEAEDFPEVLPSVISGRDQHRPYFEVLLVTPQPRSRWPAMAAEFRRLRRSEDRFVYEPVIVGSFEDALCAILVNPHILAAIVAEGFAFRSSHDAPVLRGILDKTIGKAAPARFRSFLPHKGPRRPRPAARRSRACSPPCSCSRCRFSSARSSTISPGRRVFCCRASCPP